MRIIKGSKEHLATEGAQLIRDIIHSLLESQDQVVLGLVGGTSVSTIYHELHTQDIEWELVHIFLADDRLVSEDDPQSNFHLIKKELVDHIKIPKENVHQYTSAKQYDKELNELGGRFDLVLLSAGEDGHVAGLFPQNSVLSEEHGFIEFNDSPKPPKERMSASRTLLEKSQAAIILFFGEGKKEAFKQFGGLMTPTQLCPAKIVLSLPEHYILTDLENTPNF